MNAMKFMKKKHKIEFEAIFSSWNWRSTGPSWMHIADWDFKSYIFVHTPVKDPILDSTFTIIHKELTELFLNGTKFWSFHTSVHGLDFKFFKSCCQLPSYSYSFIHSFILKFIWANDFSDGWVSTWMGLFVFTNKIRLNIAPQLFIKLNYIWWYWLCLQILLSPSSKLQNFASLQSKYLSLCFIQSCSLQFIQPIKWPQLVEHSEKLAIVFGERIVSVNIPPRLLKGH
jgi:hypothetical protein